MSLFHDSDRNNTTETSTNCKILWPCLCELLVWTALRRAPRTQNGTYYSSMILRWTSTSRCKVLSALLRTQIRETDLRPQPTAIRQRMQPGQDESSAPGWVHVHSLRFGSAAKLKQLIIPVALHLTMCASDRWALSCSQDMKTNTFSHRKLKIFKNRPKCNFFYVLKWF